MSDKRSKTSAENGKKGGRPVGSASAETLLKKKVMEEFRQKVMQSANVLFNSQLHIATGQTYLYKIEKEEIIGPRGGKSYRNKKPELVTAPWEIEAYLQGLAEGDVNDDSDPNAAYYFISAKSPDNKAIDSLLDRGLGKVAQSIVTEDEEGNSVPITGMVITIDGNPI
jgi:hypothetical protein